MNCELTTERVTERLNGLLDAAAERDLAQHLAGCPACRDEAAEIERLWAERDTTPSQLVRQLIRRYIEEQTGEPWSPGSRDSSGGPARPAASRGSRR